MIKNITKEELKDKTIFPKIDIKIIKEKNTSVIYINSYIKYKGYLGKIMFENELSFPTDYFEVQATINEFQKVTKKYEQGIKPEKFIDNNYCNIYKIIK